MGETALAVNIACNVASTAGVLVLSMETAMKELIGRIIAALGSKVPGGADGERQVD